jgi:hypothetical protein
MSVYKRTTIRESVQIAQDVLNECFNRSCYLYTSTCRVTDDEADENEEYEADVKGLCLRGRVKCPLLAIAGMQTYSLAALAN